MHNEFSNAERAEVLTQALPYIKKYTGKIVVVKYGGNAMINPELKYAVMSDIILLSLVGIKVVLVHGGGPEISGMLKKLGIESKFVNGLRYTDKDTAEVVQMVLSGKTNKDLVSLIETEGGKALGFCGIDGGMIKCNTCDLAINFFNSAAIKNSFKGKRFAVRVLALLCCCLFCFKLGQFLCKLRPLFINSLFLCCKCL